MHFGRAWHGYRYCYRGNSAQRVLDAGCGTGRTTLWAARLNPGAVVVGVDHSAAALEMARERVEAAGLDPGRVTFRRHDLSVPPPAGWGRFDFVCRGALGRDPDPPRRLAALAGALTPDGLLLLSLPSRAGRQVARALRQAVDALAPAGTNETQRRGLARTVYEALRPDHPARVHIDGLAPAGSAGDLDRLLAGYCDDRHDWTLDDAGRMLSAAGLTFLYAATPWRWRPDRVFCPERLPEAVRDGLGQLAPDRLSRLIEALDPSLLDDEFQLYACPSDYAPPCPTWPARRHHDPAVCDRLVPESTGLARLDGNAGGGRVAYKTVCGTPGELDRLSGLLMSAVDGVSSCGEIERRLASKTRSADNQSARQERWQDLADSGLLLLRPPAAT
jgi:SAM-dependent methyltransferase